MKTAKTYFRKKGGHYLEVVLHCNSHLTGSLVWNVSSTQFLGCIVDRSSDASGCCRYFHGNHGVYETQDLEWNQMAGSSSIFRLDFKFLFLNSTKRGLF